jgi:hypothetical protein
MFSDRPEWGSRSEECGVALTPAMARLMSCETRSWDPYTTSQRGVMRHINEGQPQHILLFHTQKNDEILFSQSVLVALR